MSENYVRRALESENPEQTLKELKVEENNEAKIAIYLLQHALGSEIDEEFPQDQVLENFKYYFVKDEKWQNHSLVLLSLYNYLLKHSIQFPFLVYPPMFCLFQCHKPENKLVAISILYRFDSKDLNRMHEVILKELLACLSFDNLELLQKSFQALDYLLSRFPKHSKEYQNGFKQSIDKILSFLLLTKKIEIKQSSVQCLNVIVDRLDVSVMLFFSRLFPALALLMSDVDCTEIFTKLCEKFSSSIPNYSKLILKGIADAALKEKSNLNLIYTTLVSCDPSIQTEANYLLQMDRKLFESTFLINKL